MRYQRWTIPQFTLKQTETAFRMGQHEVFAFWTAAMEGTKSPDCVVKRCVVPAQRPGQTAFGVYVHIEGKELARLEFENFDAREVNVVQLHTHPGDDVTMSDLDRKWEVVRHEGALSIIVPQYGALGLSGFPGVNVYEREVNDWRLWSAAEVRSRLEVV